MAGSTRRRTAIAVGAGAAAVLAVVAIVLLAVGGDDGDGDGGERGGAGPSTTAGDTTTTGPTEGFELVRLLSEGLNADYHARYAAPGAGGLPTGEGAFSAELWRKGDRIRQDTVVIANGQAQQVSAFLLPEGSVGCRRVGESPWLCDPIPESSAGQIQEQLVAAAQRLAPAVERVTEDEIAGQEARCFTFDATAPEQDQAGAVEEICVTTGGIPARLVSSAQTLELQLLELTVDDTAFTPPA